MSGQEIVPQLLEGVYLVGGRFVYWSGRSVWADWSQSIDRGVRFYYSLPDTAYVVAPAVTVGAVPLSALMAGA